MNGFILEASETLVMVLKKGENLVHTNIHSYSVQMTVCLVTQLCPTLCNPMDCNPDMSALLTQEAACQSQSEGPEFEPQKGQITLLGLP